MQTKRLVSDSHVNLILFFLTIHSSNYFHQHLSPQKYKKNIINNTYCLFFYKIFHYYLIKVG